MIELSIVVLAYNMARELPRIILSLSRPYQTGIDNLSYEIIVIDNNSTVPLNINAIEALAPEVRVIRNEAGISPAIAVNSAVKQAKGRHVGIVLDGARIVTPGVLALVHKALLIDESSFITTLAWHLGPEHQTISQLHGYNGQVEDRLLESIDWIKNGYKLFEISALAGANPKGWFGSLNESCCTFLSRKSFDTLGGYEEKFICSGGGYVNLDFFTRAIEVFL